MKLSVCLAASVAALAMMTGCATTNGAPSDPQLQLAAQAAIAVAVDRTVNRSPATGADVIDRAQKIVRVASALKALGSDQLSTLPAINAAIAPLLDKLHLTPLERNQADLLVSALVTIGLQRANVAQYEAQVDFILTEVLKDASAYLPPAEPSSG